MLDRLTEINWSELQAPEVPQLLLELASSDWKICADAARSLELRFVAVHEYYPDPLDRFRAELEIVPFLLELLQEESVTHKHLILALLDIMAYFATEYAGEPAVERAQQIYNRISDALDVFLSLLDNEDFQTRWAAIDVLLDFQEHRASLVQPFFRRVSVEEDPVLKAIAIWNLGEVIIGNDALEAEHGAAFLALLEKVLAWGWEETPARVVAASWLILIQRDAAPDVALDLAVAALQGALQLPTKIGSAVGAMRCGLVDLGPVRGIPAATWIVRGAVDLFSLLHGVLILLDLAFGHKKMRHFQATTAGSGRDSRGEYIIIRFYPLETGTPPDTTHVDLQNLTPMQREVLEGLLDLDRIWRNPHDLFELYGLPNTQEGLRDLLQGGA